MNTAENLNFSFPSWPVFGPEEIEAAISVLQSGRVNYWTGEEGRQFEKEFAEYVGCRHGVAVANGTLALELALRSLGIGPGDEVIVPSRTFVATGSAVVMCGATPVFADVDRNSQNVTVGSLRAAVTDRTRALIAVHLAGWPCDMDPILAFAKESGLKVIEDCAQAHGATYKGHAVGSMGDAGVFSFCQDKIMTTGGEGGMLVTNDEKIWRAAWSFKDHGKNQDAVFRQTAKPGFRWLHDSFGSNWRMTEMQAAIGRVALLKIEEWIKIRRLHASRLTACFKEIPALRVTEPPSHVRHSFYKYYVFLAPGRLKKGWDRNRILKAMGDWAIPCFSGSCSEIYRERAFAERALGPADRLPVARELGETSLMFLVHPTLAEEHIDCTCQAVRDLFSKAVK